MWEVVRCTPALSCSKKNNSYCWVAGPNSEEAGESLNEKPACNNISPFPEEWPVPQTGLLFCSFCLHSTTTSLPSQASVYVIYSEKGILKKSYKVLSRHEAQISLLAKQLPRMCLNMRLSEPNVAAGAIAVFLKASASSNLSWERGSWTLVPISGLIWAHNTVVSGSDSFLAWNFRSRARTIITNHTPNLHGSPTSASFFHAGIPDHPVEGTVYFQCKKECSV